uniref:TnpV protein n=1 Tax=Clostridium perfringens TaxID=1502 RepID=UPI0037099548
MKENNNITYKEGKDGLLYPEIVVSKENTDIGKYGKMALKYLKEKDKIRYNILLMSGEIIPTLKKLNQEAENRMEIIMEELLQGSLKIENPEDTMEAWKKRVQAREIAEEIVLKEIVYKIA